MSNPITAPDGRTWLEWAAEFLQDHANYCSDPERRKEIEAMAQACREAHGQSMDPVKNEPLIPPLR